VAQPKKKRRSKGIRPINRETKFKKLRALNCFAEVVTRIKEGWPCEKLATWIQNEAKEYTDVSHVGLSTILRQYRDAIPAAEMVQGFLPRYVQGKMDVLEEGFDELQELQNLYKLQMDRVGIDMKLEKKFQKLMPSVTQEIRTAREILSTIAELKMDLGLNDRKMGTVNVDARIAAHVNANFGSPKVAAVLADSEKRQRLTGLVKLLAKKADKKTVIDMAEAVVADEGDDAIEVEADDVSVSPATPAPAEAATL
jgi:hypothetical protein